MERLSRPYTDLKFLWPKWTSSKRNSSFSVSLHTESSLSQTWRSREWTFFDRALACVKASSLKRFFISVTTQSGIAISLSRSALCIARFHSLKHATKEGLCYITSRLNWRTLTRQELCFRMQYLLDSKAGKSYFSFLRQELFTHTTLACVTLHWRE